MPPQSTDPFFTFAQQAQDGKFDLAHGALLIARQAYPDLDVDSYLRQLDNMSQNYRAHHPPAADSRGVRREEAAGQYTRPRGDELGSGWRR